MDNTVQYKLYFLPKYDNSEDNISIETYLAGVSAHACSIIGDYIWQNEPFNLRIVTGQGDVPEHLEGSTEFGDNIDDEWFIVYLIFELTGIYPNLIASISDNDGEFMLIEAANFLPKWLEPETSANRVFIHRGQVHIVPIPSNPGEITIYPTGTPAVCQSLSLVAGKHHTQADDKIAAVINEKIASYPSKAETSIHRAHCVIPAALCHVLNRKPALIAPAVQAFYHRDPIDTKACRKMKHFPPDCLVKAVVQFTRCLYAQLMKQDFQPDKRSSWKMPLTSQPDHQAHVLGMKLAHGFEILCSKVEKNAVSDDPLARPSGRRWELYLQSLEKQGYFKNEIHGSVLYNKLLQKAEEHFKQHVLDESDSSSELPSAGEQTLKLLKEEFDFHTMKRNEKTLPPADDDGWSTISPEDLDDMLSKYNTKHRTRCKQDQKVDDIDLDSVTYSMKSFVDKVSSHVGAEFPWQGDDPDIQFDGSNFMDSIQKLLDRSSVNHDAEESSGTDDESDDLLEDSDDDVDQSDSEDNEMTQYMDEMDRELAKSSAMRSFERLNLKDAKDDNIESNLNDHSEAKEDEEEEDYPPVDIDLNLVKNLLESYSSQQGLAGPASNILQSMGMSLPHNADS